MPETMSNSIAADLSSSPTPPKWADQSFPADGGIVHESPILRQPKAMRWAPHGQNLIPTEVILTVTDLSVDGAWIRTNPRIHVEGGCFNLDNARERRTVLDAFLEAAVNDQPARLEIY
ncbi:MAG: hypothetical protein QG671_3794 [Actinomycetota bacterium]|nr:hypothetical protein [Actinomycetota bacterium]